MPNAINSYTPLLLNSNGNSTTSKLLGAADVAGPNLTDVLNARYPGEAVDQVDLSDGLETFIKENVTDDTKKAELLADLKTVKDLTSQSGVGNSTALLLGAGDDKRSAGLVNLLA